MQSVIGLLNFACSVVRRLINLTSNVRSQHFYISLNKESRADLQTWSYFIKSFDGKSVFLESHWSSSKHLNLSTDAPGSRGFVAVLGSSWFACEWPESLENYQICIKELFPIVLALEIWFMRFQNKKSFVFI